MATNIIREGWNAGTVDVVAVQGTVDATERDGTSRADGAYSVMRLPAGAIIQKVYLARPTAFDGTTPTVAIGTEGAPEKYLAATTLAAAGLIVGTLQLDSMVAVAEDIILTLVNGGSVTGEATAYISYVDTGARREIFTV